MRDFLFERRVGGLLRLDSCDFHVFRVVRRVIEIIMQGVGVDVLRGDLEILPSDQFKLTISN